LWADALDGGAELCRLDAAPGGWLIAGTVLTTLRDGPIEVRYEVQLDAAWRTRRAVVQADDGAVAASLTLDADGAGTWSIDGAAAPALAGCTDVDLEVTPATNTLPIRRLALPVGTSGGVHAAWVRFPSLAVEPSSQRYMRLGERTYEYRSGDFAARVDVDEDGLVTRYGDIWRAVLPREDA
jgi:hypothetical protein